MTDVRGWAAATVAQLGEQDVQRIVSEGAENWRDELAGRLPPQFGADELDALVEEVERLCGERVEELE